MSFSITVVFRFSRDIQKIVAFSYEDVCKDIFASLCRNKAVDFVPSRIGSYWSGGINGDTEIDVMAVDHQKKQVFAGECKYHNIRSTQAGLHAHRSNIQKLNVVRQHIRVLQRMALRLAGRGLLHLKDVPVDARDLHRNIVQVQPWLPEGNIDADVGIAPVTLRNALPNLLNIVNITHHTHAFYHKPA